MACLTQALVVHSPGARRSAARTTPRSRASIVARTASLTLGSSRGRSPANAASTRRLASSRSVGAIDLSVSLAFLRSSAPPPLEDALQDLGRLLADLEPGHEGQPGVLPPPGPEEGARQEYQSVLDELLGPAGGVPPRDALRDAHPEIEGGLAALHLDLLTAEELEEQPAPLGVARPLGLDVGL